MLYIKLHQVLPTKLTTGNFFLETDYKFQNLMAPLDSCILDLSINFRMIQWLNGCLEVVKLSLAGGMSYTDLVIIVLQSETEVMTPQAHYTLLVTLTTLGTDTNIAQRPHIAGTHLK